MNNCRALLIVFISLSLHFHLCAQTRDIDGYYINLKGDTVFGKFVNYQDYKYSPSLVPFQPVGSSGSIDLSPDKCKKLSVGLSDTYISFQGKKLANSTDYQTAQFGKADIYQEVSVFIRELFNDGHYHLYELSDPKRSNFFISSVTTPIEELYYKEYVGAGDADQNTVVQTQTYIRQLTSFFAAILEQNSSYDRFLQSVRYNDRSLTALFRKITNEKKIPVARHKYPAKLILGIGASYNKFKVNGGDPNDYSLFTLSVTGNYSSQTSPLFETGVKLFSQRNLGRLFLMIRANYYRFEDSAHIVEDNEDSSRVTFKSSVISFPVSIGYKLINDPNFSFELSGGATYLLLLKNTEEHIQYGGNGSYISPAPRKNAFGFFGEAAVVFFNRISAYAGYYSPVSVTGAGSYDASHTSIKFGLRCYLF